MCEPVENGVACMTFPILKTIPQIAKGAGDTIVAGPCFDRELRELEQAEIADWTELELRLVSYFQLDSVSICLLPDFVSSESISQLGKFRAREVDAESVLLEVTVGYRVRLAIHLVRDCELSVWPLEPYYEALVRHARQAFDLSVGNRVVELIADKKSEEVAWFYLNLEGEIETVSTGAAAFCREHCPSFDVEEGVFSEALADYVDGVRKMADSDLRLMKSGGYAFAYAAGTKVIVCQLRRMAGSGFLLSLSLDF